MNPDRQSSEPESQLDECKLAVLAACHHRGALTVAELGQLLAMDMGAAPAGLVTEGLLDCAGERFAMTQKGRDFLDRVLEGIESHLSPDAPEYVHRHRRPSPTLPFDTNTVWAEAVAINVRVKPSALRPLIPSVFELDIHDGNAFVSLTASRLKNFGVGWLPSAMRMNFYQSTYRAHVTFTDFRGRTLRGCYFIRSETNSALMSLTANMLPEFKAHRCGTCPILMARQGDHWVLTVDSGNDPAGKVVLVLNTSAPMDRMPGSSCFTTVEKAYDFLVDFYDAFSYEPETGEVYFLQIDRGDWDIQIVEPVDYYLGYFSDGPFPPGTTELDSVFYFRNVPYRWLPLLKEKVQTRRCDANKQSAS